MIRILYGGTFDPVHEGHLAVADAAAKRFDTEVALLPSADPPHRAPPGASALDRAAMLDLAIEGHPRLRVDRRELHRAGPSYSVDTIREVRAEIGVNTSLAWLLGADAFRDLATWHHWRELFSLAHLIVAARPGYPLDGLSPELQAEVAERWAADPFTLERASAGRVFRLDLHRQESATAVRGRLADGTDADEHVPSVVSGYIRRHGLYGCRTT
jgi:nicotinate-nucleotide adenylyltransferase